MPLVFRLLSRMPLGVLYVLGAVAGWGVFLLSPTYRRRFLDNARQAGYGLRQVRSAVAHAGRMVLELPRLWLGEAPRCVMHNPECVEQAWKRGKGIIFVTPHLGGFEWSVQEAAIRWSAAHGPITVLFRPPRQAWLADWMAQGRRRKGMQAVPTTLSGVRQMLKALRRGEAVGLLPDQVPPQGLGTWQPFFGRDAYTMTLAARLVQQTDATVIVARCERRSWGFDLYLDALSGPWPDELEQAVRRINEAMEDSIRCCPEQYLWGYARYKSPRPLAAQEEQA